MKSNMKKLVFAAMMASFICISTMAIKIPSPLGGFINIGDSVVLITAWLLSPLYAMLASGIGSAIADLLSGYIVYAPVTFIVKGLMAIGAYYTYRKLVGKTTSKLVSAIVAEIIMITGYYIFEGFLYGFIPALVNMPANVLQGISGILLAIVASKFIDKSNVVKRFTID